MSDARADGAAARHLATAGALALAGLLPIVATREPVALVAWFALVAPGAGVLASSLPAWPWAPMVPAAWMAALALATIDAERVLPTPAFAAALWTGLFFAGHGFGRVVRDSGARVAALTTLLSFALAALPVGLGLVDAPFPSAWTARFLLFSPVRWALECAGVDWLHHAAFYERARTFDLGPELLARPRPALAGALALVVGCLVAWAGSRVSRAANPAPAR